MKLIADPALKAAVDSQNPQSWVDAAFAVVKFLVDNKSPFSSGEVAAALRTHFPEYRFSVLSLGQALRDAFYGGRLPNYTDEAGDDVCVVLSPRYTEGLYPTRTPAGVEVFVYGPSPEACDSHPFEVFVPRVGADGSVEAEPAPSAPTIQPNRGDLAGTSYKGEPIYATVKQDSRVGRTARVRVPRKAVEALCHLDGKALLYGVPVFVQVANQKAVIALDPFDGAKEYSIWGDDGCVVFSADVTTGSTFECKIGNGKIEIAL